MSLGLILKNTRKKVFYTQEDFKKKLDVDLSTVNRWELNKAKPNLKAMKAIKNFCENNELDYNIIEQEWLNSSREDGND